MTATRRTFFAALAVCALAACGGGPVEFPPGLDPLEPDTAPEPAEQGGDPHPEAVLTTTGVGDGFEYAHAKGYVHASLSAVFAALQDPPTVVDRRRVAVYTATKDVEQGYDVSFRVHNEVHDIVTVEFDTTWREGVVQGDKASPEVVAARAAKTDGTAYITLLEDSVVLTKVDAEVTKVELVRHIKSATAGAPEAEQYLQDLYASLKAKSHGEALPTY